jgi:hypothetical protein
VARKIEIEVVSKTKDFGKGMAESKKHLGNLGKAAGAAGLAIAGGLAVGLEKSVNAAMEAQTSQAKLAQAFKNAGLSAAKLEPQVKTLEAASRKLGFTEEEVHSSLSSLITATHDYGQARKEVTVAEDVARFKSVSLTDATKMLTMAQTGSQRAAKQLGITVSPVTKTYDDLKAGMGKVIDAHEKLQLATAKLTDKQLTGQAVIDSVSAHVKGQAAAYSQTAAGGMEAFKAQLNYLEISLGTALLPALAKVSAEAAKMTAWLTEHPKLVHKLVIGLGLLSGALITARVAQVALNIATETNPYVAAISAVVAAGIAIYIFRDKLMNVFNWIKAHYPLLAGIIAGPIGLALAEIVKHRDAIANAFTSLPGMIGNAISGAMGDLKAKLQSIFSWHRIVGWIRDALGFGSPSPHFMAIGHDMVDSMAKGVGGAAGVLKDAVFRLAKQYAGSYLGKIPGLSGTIIGQGPGSGIHASPAVAKQYAVTQLKNFGWGPSEMTPLYKLWNQESGWRWNAQNGSLASGAYGIPQSHPPSKMAQAGADWLNNAFTQINWGLGYIKSVYGSPSRAWAQDVAGGLKGYNLGGTVPGLRGEPRLAIVHGGERITPPGSARGASGGGVVNYNTFSFPNYIGSHSELAAAVQDAFETYQHRNGRSYGGGF